MKKVRNAIALFLALIVIAVSALASSSKVITAYNKLKYAGSSETFDLKLLWSNTNSDGSWNLAENSAAGVPFSSDTLWEPGYTEIRYFKIQNNGSVDFDYELKIDSSAESDFEYTGILADAIDVYVSSDSSAFSSLISSSNKIGTLSDCFDSAAFYATVSDNDSDNLVAGDEKTFAVGFKMRTDAGNEYQGYVDGSGVKQNKIKFTISAAASAPEPKPMSDGVFGLVFENTDEMLYRVGNRNNITVSSLFVEGEESTGIDSSKVSFEWVNNQSSFSSKLTYTANTTDWTAGTLKFTGEGVGTLWLKYNGERRIALDLEVLTANNFIDSTSLAATSYDAVLLKNISTSGRFSISNGHTLYGNGFEIEDVRTDTITGVFCTISGGSLDNVHIKGQEYPSMNMYYSDQDYFSPCVRISSNTSYPKNYINNSHISGCSDAMVVAAETYMDNSLVSGGAVSNIDVTGKLYMNNCATSLSLNEGAKKGLAIIVGNESAHVTLTGTFNQYNWVKKSDFPSDYSSFVSDIYSKSDYSAYRYTYNGNSYINLGIMCANTGIEFTEDKARTVITDNTVNKYGYITKTAVSITATCYVKEAATITDSTMFLSSFDLPGQSPTVPGSTYPQYNGFNIGNTTSNPNYKALTDMDSSFCVFDNSTRMIKLSYGADSQYEWNPMILSAKKYGIQLSYTVSMNGTDYTNKKIVFSQPGNYVVTYRFSDPYYFYERNGALKQGSIDYSKTLNIFVAGPKAPTITFNSYSTKAQIINNEIYLMPDVSETSSSIGSLTKNGVTVYYIIVPLDATNDDATGAYSSGNALYYTPVFKNVNIIDYYQSNDNNSEQYRYNSSSTTWPHNRAASEGPNPTVFDYVRDGNIPYGAMGESYYGYINGKDGLGYTRSLDHGDSNLAASTQTVHWFYSANNGLTYNFYVQYQFSSFSYSACFASGTMITLSDGSMKPIENITYDDKLLVWNFFTGSYDEQSVAILVNHGKDTYKVVNTMYSDGTVLRTIGEHGVFDYDLNKYIYLTEYNFKDYIGHRFVKYNSSGGYNLVTLKGGYVTTEQTYAYSITSACSSNAFAEGMLTVAPPDDFYNWIDMGDKLRYDTDAFNADVEKYGLYDYDVFSDYVTYEQYAAFNGPYLKVAVEKGKFSFDYIIELIKTYL